MHVEAVGYEAVRKSQSARLRREELVSVHMKRI